MPNQEKKICFTTANKHRGMMLYFWHAIQQKGITTYYVGNLSLLQKIDLNSCFPFWDLPTQFWLLQGLLWYFHWLLFQILLPALSCRSHHSGKVVSDHPTQNKEEFSLIANQIRVTPKTVFQGGLSEPMTVSLERTIRIRLIDKQF